MADERPASPAVQARYPRRAGQVPQRTAQEIHDRAMQRASEPLRLASHGLVAARPKLAAPENGEA